MHQVADMEDESEEEISPGRQSNPSVGRAVPFTKKGYLGLIKDLGSDL